MHKILSETRGAFVALQLTGKLDETDYREIVPLLETRIAEHGKIALYWEMKSFEGWTPGGLWADTKFDIHHANDFARIAIVGEKKWHEWMASLMKPFTGAEVRYFDLDERQQALDWSRQAGTM